MCPADFTYISSVNGCYKVVTGGLERGWSVAGLECRALHKDAHLLVINDAAEQSAVVGMLESMNRKWYFMCSSDTMFRYHVARGDVDRLLLIIHLAWLHFRHIGFMLPQFTYNMCNFALVNRFCPLVMWAWSVSTATRRCGRKWRKALMVHFR